MKNPISHLIFFSVICLLLPRLHGQEFFDTFEIGDLDSSYTVLNVDGLTPALIEDSLWLTHGWLIDKGEVFNGRAALSISWYQDTLGNEQGPADDWLILPRLKIDSAASLRFDARSATTSGNFPDDYVVMLNTGDPTKADFESNGVILLEVEDEVSNRFASYDLDLSAYAGDSVYLAFRNVTDTTGYGLWIDNLYVGGTAATSLDVENVVVALQLSPNPASEALRIDYHLAQAGEVEVLVRNLQGQVVIHHQESRVLPGDQVIELEVSELPCGSYLVNLVAGETVAATRLLVFR